MAVPIISQAVLALLSRYGIKALKGKQKGDLAREAARIAKAKAKSLSVPKSDIIGETKSLRRKQVASNIARDALAGSSATYGISNLIKLSAEKDKDEMRRYVKRNHLKLWKDFTTSSYDDIEEFLKSVE